MSSEPAPALLLVDDEEVVLAALRALFTLEPEYEVVAHTRPRDALEVLRSRRVDVIIADFLMPRTNGIEFLKEARQIQPDATRILLTGFADKENAIRAINEVQLYQYLEKPWDNDALLMTVRNALAEKGLRRQLGAKIGELAQLSREYTDLTHRHRLLERELALAARVHRTLLPERLPDAGRFRFDAAYQPSVVVGGDFYDLVGAPESPRLLVADTSGHGLPAAMTTMVLKDIFRDAGMRIERPLDLLGEMNDRLRRVLPFGMYAAAILATVDPVAGTVEIASAGLPYPFWLRAGLRRADELVLNGFPLGLFPGTALDGFETRSIVMDPGDVLLLGTDGLPNAENAEGKMFGEGPMNALLGKLAGRGGGEVIRSLLEAGKQFTGGDGWSDDVNLVAITQVPDS